MEVIVRKKSGLMPLFVICIALGVLCIGGGVFCFVLGGYSIIPAIVLTILGIAAATLSLLGLWNWKKMPTEIAYVVEEKIQLPEGRYAFNEISNVSYRCLLSVLKVRWGKLYIEINGKVFAYAFVEDVAETQQLLLSLRLSDCNAPIDR